MSHDNLHEAAGWATSVLPRAGSPDDVGNAGAAHAGGGRRATVIMLLVASMLSLAAPSAVAETVAVSDRPDDATMARWEFKQMRFTHERDRVTAVARVSGLRAGGRQTFGINLSPVRVPGWPQYMAESNVRADGSVHTRLRLFHDGGFRRVPCRIRSRWRFARDRVSLSFPQRCLAWHKTMRVMAFVGTKRHGDPADATRLIRVRYR